MKESILEKISELVAKGIESEAECVYLLAQIRKFIEQQQIQGHWNLRMCANWTLHSQLNNSTVQEFLSELNAFLIDSEARHDYDLTNYPSLKGKLSFVTSLKSELSDFLNSVGIDSSICANTKFRHLLKIFGCVIEDTPLICKSNSPLSHLSEVSFSRRPTVFSKGLPPLALSWTIKKATTTILRIQSNITVIPVDGLEVYTETFSFITNVRESF